MRLGPGWGLGCGTLGGVIGCRGSSELCWGSQGTHPRLSRQQAGAPGSGWAAYGLQSPAMCFLLVWPVAKPRMYLDTEKKKKSCVGGQGETKTQSQRQP